MSTAQSVQDIPLGIAGVLSTWAIAWTSNSAWLDQVYCRIAGLEAIQVLFLCFTRWILRRRFVKLAFVSDILRLK